MAKLISKPRRPALSERRDSARRAYKEILICSWHELEPLIYARPLSR